MNKKSDHPESVLDQADQIRLKDLARQLDQAAVFPDEALDVIVRNRHFHLFIPKERGGLDLPLVEGMRIIEAYAAIEGNLGWIVQIGAGGGIFAAYLEEEVARRFFGRRDQVIAGSDFVGGRARREADGYRVSGEWKYASGACHATAFTGNCRIESAPLKGQVRAVIVPAEEVKIIYNWNAMGMRATDSHSFQMEDVFVPESHLFVVDPNHLKVHNRTTYLHFEEFARALFLPVLTGETYRYLEMYKHYMTSRSYGKDSAAAVAFHNLESVWDDSRRVLFGVAEEIWCDRANDPVPAREDSRFAALSAQITDEILYNVDQCHRHTGMSGIRMDEEINISYRNIKTVAAHHLLKSSSHLS